MSTVANPAPSGRPAEVANVSILALATRVRILDLDGAVVRQAGLLGTLGSRVDTVPLRHLEPRLRFMATGVARRELERALRPEDRECLTFFGSGDFHHVTAALLAQWRTQLSVVVFDGHPDWDITSPWSCCGCWVNEALALPAVRKVVVIGLGRTELHAWHVLRGNLRAVRAGRLELFPATWTRSKTLLSPTAALPCATIKSRGLRSDIRWRTVAASGLADLMKSVIDRLPTREVYVSIDKDCPTPADAVTNWEPGDLSLMDVCGALRQLAETRDIVGADITGEWSQSHIDNPLFRAIARHDHPRQVRPTVADLQRNERTNLTLCHTLLARPMPPAQAGGEQ